MRSINLALLSSLFLLSVSANGSHQYETHTVEIESSKHTATWVVQGDLGHHEVSRPWNISHHPHGALEKHKDDTTGRYGFTCQDKFYTQKKIMRAANAACEEISANEQNSKFPALHTAFTYNKLGPYVEWPIKRYGGYFNIAHRYNKGRDRLVMTMECKVVGAVRRNKKDNSYEKCKLERH